METIDREYCWGIDDAHHNITDGHVVHHLFFTKIPHYNLMKATATVRPYLERLGVYSRTNCQSQLPLDVCDL
jgi:acyl-lipid omega-3 desaturase